MSELGYRVLSENGRSFILFVDEVPLAQAIGATDDSIPYWIVTRGIPGWPPSKAEPTPLDRVTFDQFEGNFSASASSLSFAFERGNLDRVMGEISRLADEQGGHQGRFTALRTEHLDTTKEIRP